MTPRQVQEETSRVHERYEFTLCAKPCIESVITSLLVANSKDENATVWSVSCSRRFAVSPTPETTPHE